MRRSIERQRSAVAISFRTAGGLVLLAIGAISSPFLGPVSAEPTVAAPAQAETQSQRPDPDPDDPALAGHFSGQVTDLDGQPLAGARIYLADYDYEGMSDAQAAVAVPNAGRARARTDAEGRFEFYAPDMTYADLDGLPSPRYCLVIATAAGFAPEWIDFHGRSRGRNRMGSFRQPFSGIGLAFKLAKNDVPIRGRLMSPLGEPLSGAHVELTALTIPPTTTWTIISPIGNRSKRSSAGMSGSI